MALQLDRALDNANAALLALRESMRGMPIRREGLKKHHDDFTRRMGTFTTELSDARSRIKT